ncbi:DUF4365 domain-containing protein [Paracidovorax oryzae]|uniref:DUF4365 domain-containing protein n=1 Tax=Paracidovorax oryzae TaxID=862720 RepID=UPI0035CF3F97
MQPLSLANVESELSYAYLHAVASHAQCSCKVTNRHEDNAGVDAQLVGWGPFEGGGYRTEVDIKVQLKATVAEPTVIQNCFSYNFRGISQYNDLRSETVATPRILVVLFLPPEYENWICHSMDSLSLHRCAYWVSLRGAPESTNATAQTVYIPKTQKFDSAGLISLMTRLSRNEIPTYQEIAA